MSRRHLHEWWADVVCDWLMEGGKLHSFPVLLTLPLWIVAYVGQVLTMTVYAVCRLFLPRRWCP